MRNKVCSGESTSIRKLNSKPLVPTALVVTLTDSSASTTDFGARIGTTGPIHKVIWMAFVT
jgi:hypothetical protein